MQNLERLISNLNLDSVNSDINSTNFPDQEPNTDTRVFSFGVPITTDTVLTTIEDAGYTPANLYDLLAWADGKWNKQDFVIALGCDYSVKTRDRLVPAAPALFWGGNTKGTRLSLDAWGKTWNKGASFLAVKKEA